MAEADIVTLAIECKSKNAEQALSRFNSAMERSIDTASNLKKAILGALASKELFSFARESIRVYSDLAEETQKFNVVFQGLGNKTKKILKEMQRDYGQSELSALRMLALTGDMLSGFGFGRQQALDMAEAVAKLGADIASFSNYAGGAENAAFAITKAMLGETEQAKMLGIAIKTDTPEYQKLLKEIIATTGATETQAKAIAALRMAYEQSPNAIGDFKRNMASLANQERILSNNLVQLKSNVGEVFSESFLAGVKTINALTSEFNEMEEPSRKALVRILAIASGVAAIKTVTAGFSLINAFKTNLETSENQKKQAQLSVIEAEEKSRTEMIKRLEIEKTNLTEKRSLSVKEALTARKILLDKQEIASQKAKNLAFERDSFRNQELNNAQRYQEFLQNGNGTFKEDAGYIVAQKRLNEATKEYQTATKNASDAAKKYNESKQTAININNQLREASINLEKAITIAGNASASASIKMGIMSKAGYGLKKGLLAAGNGLKALYAALGPIGTGLIAIQGASYLIDELDIMGKKAINMANDLRERILSVAEAQRERQTAIKNSYTENQKNLNILQQLDKQEYLTQSGQRTAISIIEQLRKSNMDLGITYDSNTKKILGLAGAQEKLNELYKKQSINNLKKQLISSEEEISAIRKESDAILNKNTEGVKGAIGGFIEGNIKYNFITSLVNKISGGAIKRLYDNSDFFDDKEKEAALAKNQVEITKAYERQRQIREDIAKLEKGDIESEKELAKQASLTEISLRNQLLERQREYKFSNLTSSEQLKDIQEQITEQRKQILDYSQRAIAGEKPEEGQKKTWEERRLEGELKLIELKEKERNIEKELAKQAFTNEKERFTFQKQMTKSVSARRELYQKQIDLLLEKARTEKDETKKMEYLSEADTLNESIKNSFKGTDTISGVTTAFNAVIAGTAEAARLESKRYEKSPLIESNKKIAENTKKIENEVRILNSEIKKENKNQVVLIPV